MNLGGAVVGGVPMCHGAGGKAGHVAFGARTAGALIILGTILLALALFFSDSVEALFRLFPPAVLGVILFLTGCPSRNLVVVLKTHRAVGNRVPVISVHAASRS
jgi:MFS superfamily sulfate permease-like transporter